MKWLEYLAKQTMIDDNIIKIRNKTTRKNSKNAVHEVTKYLIRLGEHN